MAVAAAIAVAVTALLIAGCGDSSSGASTPAVVEIVVDDSKTEDSSFEGPKSIDAGPVTLKVVNRGDEPHDAQLMRVDDGRPAKQVIDAVVKDGDEVPPPEWLHGAGGSGVIEPGEVGTSTQVLDGGTYYLVDTRAGGNDGIINVAKGGIHRIEVEGDGEGDLPETEARIVADEYGFEASGIDSRTDRVTFENAGDEPHRLVAFPVRDGVSFEQAREIFKADPWPYGGVPIESDGIVGTAMLDGGTSQVTRLSLRSGTYALVCFLKDREGGEPHSFRGMVSELRVP